MARLRGIGLGAGMALGTAAVVQVRGGIALMPEAPPRIAALVTQRRLLETPEVVLVAEEYRTAQAIAASLSWARVVGIAAEREDRTAAVTSVPAVTGLAGLMQAAADDVLILVDATRGVALVDPDPVYLAQYTAEHDRVAPKNRIYLDEEHLPAQTQDGRTISVMAMAITEHSVEVALASGPDALYHPLPLTFDPMDLRRHLDRVLSVAAGKPLTVPYNSSLPLTPLVESASHADITIAIAALDHIYGSFTAPTSATLSQILMEIESAQSEAAERDVLFGVPRIAVEIANRQAGADWPPDDKSGPFIEALAAAGATRMILFGATEGRSMKGLSSFVSIASVNLLPVTFVVDPDAVLTGQTGAVDPSTALASTLRLLIGAGITGFLVSPALTQSAKAAIRSTDLTGCLEAYAQWVNVS